MRKKVEKLKEKETSDTVCTSKNFQYRLKVAFFLHSLGQNLNSETGDGTTTY